MDTSKSSSCPLKHRIGFIGGGQMAFALAKGFMGAGLVKPSQVISELELEFQAGIDECSETSDTPKRILTSVSKLYVSVMAGTTINTLSTALNKVVGSPRIIRTHPNTPAMVGCGCAVYSRGNGATDQDGDLIKQLFSSVGIIEQVPEYQQDAFTGMAGSGPAYIYTIIEALSDGGVRMGLPRQLAANFAAQMTMGAAKMALESGKHTGQLKDEVTSPGGTTIRGIQVLEKAGIRGTLMEAVQASAERAIELGGGK